MQNSTIETSGSRELTDTNKAGEEQKPRAMSYLAMRKRQEMSKLAAATKEKEEVEVVKKTDEGEEPSKSKCEECGARRLITNSV